MINRIEEVKKILDKYRGAFICDNKCQDRTNETIAQEICQLFPQPLDEKELKAKIDEALIALVSSTRLPAECPEVLLLPEIFRTANYIYSALLQPKIEEEGVRFSPGISGIAWHHKGESNALLPKLAPPELLEATISLRVEEAKREERERIGGLICCLAHDNPKCQLMQLMNDKGFWQALKKGESK